MSTDHDDHQPRLGLPDDGRAELPAALRDELAQRRARDDHQRPDRDPAAGMFEPATPERSRYAQPVYLGAGVVWRRHIIVSRQNTIVHVIHGALTLLSLGAWAPVWVCYAITARWRTILVEVDASGHATGRVDDRRAL